MTMTRRLKLTIPFVLLFLLFSMLFHELYSATPRYASSMKGEPLPNFQVPDLFNSQKTFSAKNIRGKASLLTVWATWCTACRVEHPMLEHLKNQYHVPMYGIVYKDDAQEAIRYLKRKGNPFIMVGNDFNGDAATDLGIYGTPETFVISPEGRIVYRYLGVITPHVWENKIYPILKQYEN